ncbi:hypothetical protein GQ473_00645 [archaeon]|nr:hypothetical protein [archaeon]
MKIEKTEKLKHYTEQHLIKKLSRISNNLDDDLLCNNMITRKEIIAKINRIIYCNDRHIENERSLTNVVTGEIIKTEKTHLYGCSCGNFSLCSICSSKRSNLIYYKYIDHIKEQYDKYKYVSMITFTIKDQKSLNESWQKLNRGLLAWRKMGQRRGDSFSGGEAAKIKSGIGCFEITSGRNSKLFHTHIHALVFSDDIINYQVYDQKEKQKIIQYYNEQLGYEPRKEDLRPAALMPVEIENENGKTEEVLFSKLSMEWHIATNGAGINIKCSPIKKNIPIEKQLREIIKYTTKTIDLDEHMIYELLACKDKKRFLTTWGELYGINRNNNNDNTDIVDADFTDIPTEENEEFLEIDNIEAIRYSPTEGTFHNNEKDTKMGEELFEKKDELKQFRIVCNFLRSIKDGLLNSIQPEVELILGVNIIDQQTPEYKSRRMDIINEIDTIRSVYRLVCEKQFNEIVDVSIRNKKKKTYPTKRAQFYIKCFSDSLKIKKKKWEEKQKLVKLLHSME